MIIWLNLDKVVYMVFFAESTLPGTHRCAVTFHLFLPICLVFNLIPQQIAASMVVEPPRSWGGSDCMEG